MRISYGVNKRIGKRITHQNGVVDLPKLPDSDFDNAHQMIRTIISTIHPGWLITGYALAKPELKVEMVCADWKDFEGFVGGLIEALPKLGLTIIKHPDFEGSDMVGVLISNRPLTEAELADEMVHSDLSE